MLANLALALALAAAASPLPPFLQAARARFGPPTAGRSLALCERKDDTDSSIAKCDDWCKWPDHCSYCKCRACSLCQPCESEVADDIAWEGCEEWCSVHDHCSSCKCARARTNSFLRSMEATHHACRPPCRNVTCDLSVRACVPRRPRVPLLPCVHAGGRDGHRLRGLAALVHGQGTLRIL